MADFVTAFTDLQADIRAATGLRICWKDVDPAQWLVLPAAISQHRHPYCLAIKRSAERNRQCCQADNVTAADWPQPVARRRTCPFQVIEHALPQFQDGTYVGCCYLGTWRSASAPEPDVAQTAFASLPIYDQRQAQAVVQLLQRMLPTVVAERQTLQVVEDPRLNRVRAHIHDHLGADLRASAVAAVIHVSPSRFVHWFKDVTGTTFTSYLHHQLMRQATIFLVQEQTTVAAIADRLRYSSPAYFSAAFQRFHGEPPGRWRERVRATGA